MQYFKAAVPYKKTIDAHSRFRDARGFVIYCNVIEMVVLPLICEGTKRSVNFVCGSLKHIGNESSKLTVTYGTWFDVFVSYIVAGVSFCRVTMDMIVLATNGKLPRLSEMNENHVRWYTQAFIGSNLEKVCRRVVSSKVWAFNNSSDQSTYRGYLYVYVRNRVCVESIENMNALEFTVKDVYRKSHA